MSNRQRNKIRVSKQSSSSTYIELHINFSFCYAMSILHRVAAGWHHIFQQIMKDGILDEFTMPRLFLLVDSCCVLRREFFGGKATWVLLFYESNTGYIIFCYNLGATQNMEKKETKRNPSKT